MPFVCSAPCGGVTVVPNGVAAETLASSASASIRVGVVSSLRNQKTPSASPYGVTGFGDPWPPKAARLNSLYAGLETLFSVPLSENQMIAGLPDSGGERWPATIPFSPTAASGQSE